MQNLMTTQYTYKLKKEKKKKKQASHSQGSYRLEKKKYVKSAKMLQGLPYFFMYVISSCKIPICPNF